MSDNDSFSFPDNVEWHDEAKVDFNSLDRSQKLIVVKAIVRVAQKPQAQNEGGYGKPLGNRNAANLKNLLKVKLKSSGLRIVYQYVIEGNLMKIIVISIRDDEKVYKIAAKRLGR